MKSVRFSQVVEESGPPEPYTLWSAPEHDAAFQGALKQHRVMTVHQDNTGAKSDFGEVGYAEDRQGSLLIFPKSVQRFAGRRVIGIKYDLLEQPPAAPAPAANKKPARVKPAAKPKAAPAPTFPPLQVVPRAAPEPPKPAPAPPPKNPAEELARLTREVRRAMKQLKAGKAVAAYETLEAALGSRG